MWLPVQPHPLLQTGLAVWWNLTCEGFYCCCLAFPWKSLASGDLSSLFPPCVLVSVALTCPWASPLLSLASSSLLVEIESRMKITLVASPTNWERDSSQGQPHPNVRMLCFWQNTSALVLPALWALSSVWHCRWCRVPLHREAWFLSFCSHAHTLWTSGSLISITYMSVWGGAAILVYLPLLSALVLLGTSCPHPVAMLSQDHPPGLKGT